MTRRTAYLIPLIVGFALAVALFIELRAENERHMQASRLEVFYKMSVVQGHLEEAVATRLQLGGAFKAFVMLNSDVEQETFHALVRSLLGNMSGVRAIMLAKNNIVTHAFPTEIEELVLSKSLLSDFPVPLQNLTRKMLHARVRQVSRQFPLEGRDVVAIMTPVYLPDPTTLTTSRYWGCVVVFIDAQTIYREAGLISHKPTLEMALRSISDGSGAGEMLVGAGKVFEMSPVTMNISIPGGYWQMGAVPNGGWPPSPYRNQLIYGGGAMVLAVTGLLLATVYFLLNGIKEREKYRYLVQNAKSIILRVDVKGIITFCNEYTESFFGYEPGELVGKELVGSLIPAKSLDGKPMKRIINRLIHTQKGTVFNEYLHKRKNGEMVWVSWATEPVLGRDDVVMELLCVGTDITDRKITEEALKQSERQYRMLAENITDIIWGLDAGRRFTYISPSDESLRGFKRHEVLSRPIGEFLTPQSLREFEESVKRLLFHIADEGNPPSTILDLEFLCADDSTVWLETRIGLMLNDDRELIGLQGVGRDISDRKRADALRDDVERIARHDLKTPLGAVVGLPEEIRRLGGLSGTQDEMLNTIETAGETMLDLINRSLDLFKMESGTYELRKTSVDILKVIDCIRKESRAIIHEKGISLGVEVLDQAFTNEFRVFAEEPLLRSMLSNLLLNAFQASPEGCSVTVTLTRTPDVVIVIRNKGEVPPGVRENFFEKYVSSDNSSGSGIGTYSARQIARTHGGDIMVDTCEPGHTCVTVSLPR